MQSFVLNAESLFKQSLNLKKEKRVAYAGEQKPRIKVCGVRPLENHKLWLRFTTGEAKVFDFTEILNTPAFAPLEDKMRFDAVYIDFGAPTWENGTIDIDPEYLYEHAVPVEFC